MTFKFFQIGILSAQFLNDLMLNVRDDLFLSILAFFPERAVCFKNKQADSPQPVA